jgi:hypothetical protein
MKNKSPRVHTVGLRKPTLGARVLHITINNRAWLHDAMIKPLKRGGKKHD